MKLKVKKQVTKTKKPTVQKVRKLTPPEPQSKRGRDGGNEKFKALSDEYKPEVLYDKKVLVKDFKTQKGGMTKIYLVFKVQRFDKDDGQNLGLPYVFIQMYQECEKKEGYTGYLKGHSVHFPLEMMYDVLDNLTELSDTCDRLKVE